MLLFFAYLGHGCCETGASNAINALTIEKDLKSGKLDLVSFLIQSVVQFDRTVTFALLDCCRSELNQLSDPRGLNREAFNGTYFILNGTIPSSIA